MILDKRPSNRLITKVEMTQNRMFPLKIQSKLLQKAAEFAFKALHKNESWLWHLRFDHYIRELVNNGDICLKFWRSKEQLADIFTKPLAKNVFEHLRGSIGIIDIHGSED